MRAEVSAELLRFIRQEIRTQLCAILNCYVGESTTEDQEIDQPVPGAGKMNKRPVAHPYGFVSRAPVGTLGVTGRVGDHPGARMLLAYRDKARADMTWLKDGEACLYNANGDKIIIAEDKVQLGSEAAANPVVLGNELVDLLGKLMDLIITGDFLLVTSPGNPTAPNPAKASQVTTWKSTYLTTANTNIVSQQVFTERKK